jgi:hypothetical protein
MQCYCPSSQPQVLHFVLVTKGAKSCWLDNCCVACCPHLLFSLLCCAPVCLVQSSQLLCCHHASPPASSWCCAATAAPCCCCRHACALQHLMHLLPHSNSSAAVAETASRTCCCQISVYTHNRGLSQPNTAHHGLQTAANLSWMPCMMWSHSTVGHDTAACVHSLARKAQVSLLVSCFPARLQGCCFHKTLDSAHPDTRH